MLNMCFVLYGRWAAVLFSLPIIMFNKSMHYKHATEVLEKTFQCIMHLTTCTDDNSGTIVNGRIAEIFSENLF